MKTRKAIIIGAGIVGCSTALALAESGWEVNLLDAEPGPGLRTSQANGAQLSYSYVEPLATPATLSKIPSLLFSASSPLTLRLRADVHQWSWLARFLLACNTARVQASTRELLALARLSRDTLDGWMQQNSWDCEYTMPGKLVLYGDEESLSDARRQVAFQKALGSRQDVVPAARCAEIEPALAAYAPTVAGGVWTADECVIDPLRLTRSMTARLQADGHAVMFNCPVLSLIVHGSRVCGVRTAVGEMQADAVVVCAGVDINRLIAGLSPRLPVYPIKGYSVTLDMLDAAAAPSVSVTDAQRKLVFARLGNRVRVAGRAELVGYGTTISARAIDELLDGMRTVFPAARWAPDVHPWAGLRPATPTGLPICGATKTAGLFVNAGHGALGLTLAAGTARRVADVMKVC
ncbi:D-amino acid dehydrogenase [soil metagenome]